jgi:hypothetical protein
MWVYIWNKLPSEYQEVEYIQTNPTTPWNWNTAWQYIDAWLKVTPTTKVSIDFQFLSTAVQQRIFSVNEEPSWINFWLYINWSSYFTSVTTTWGFSWKPSSKTVDTSRYTHTLQASTYTILNSSWTQIYSGSTTWSITGTSSQNMVLLGNTNPNTWIEWLAYAKLYWCKIRDNWTLVRNFVPCYRKSDSVIGLYDLVNNQFYTNSWSGTFTKWSDVNTYRESLLKNAYIGEVWTPTSNTLWYYPLTSQTTVNDMSGNWNNLTNNWVTFWNYGWHDSGIFNRNWFLSLNKSLVTWWQDFSVNVWFKYSVQDYYQTILWVGAENSNYNFLIWAQSNNHHLMLWWWNNDKDTWYVLNGDWKNCVVTHSGWTAKVYINWSLIYTGSVSYNISNNVTRIWYWVSTSTSWSGGKFEWWISEVIIENNVWSADKVLNYYNNTKANYWL